ncbi:hypothetical protein Cus16_0844 [Curtobacterium sp. ER1/6]|nr:hypothetical protein Cus16_0844 [Curtobacterium sp. ER1/6]
MRLDQLSERVEQPDGVVEEESLPPAAVHHRLPGPNRSAGVRAGWPFRTERRRAAAERVPDPCVRSPLSCRRPGQMPRTTTT